MKPAAARTVMSGRSLPSGRHCSVRGFSAVSLWWVPPRCSRHSMPIAAPLPRPQHGRPRRTLAVQDRAFQTCSCLRKLHQTCCPMPMLQRSPCLLPRRCTQSCRGVPLRAGTFRLVLRSSLWFRLHLLFMRCNRFNLRVRPSSMTMARLRHPRRQATHERRPTPNFVVPSASGRVDCSILQIRSCRVP